MPTLPPSTCAGCGAKLSAEAVHCDLCGTTVGEPIEALAETASATLPADQPSASPPTLEPDAAVLSSSPAGNTAGIFCNQCGWQNPAQARFCSQCGSPLDARLRGTSLHSEPDRPAAPPDRSALPAGSAASAEPAVSDEPAEAEGASLGRQVTILIGSGVLLVIALFLITVVSQQTQTTPSTSQTQTPLTPSGPPPALSPTVAAQANTLLSEIEQLGGEAKLAKQYELVNLYISATRYDLAANVQEAIAETENTEISWTRAGNLFYDWMDLRPPEDKARYAKQAINAYQRVLAINPDNLSVRTDMAIAYMYDPDNPMEAIRQTNLVLEADPNHVQANFNRGVMLMQINRLDQALAQFEKVKTIVGDPNDEVYQRADAVMASIRQRQNATG